MKHIKSRFWALTLLIISMVLPSAAWAEGGHQLTVVAKPTMAGTFNKNSAELVAGETIHLYAYANNSFTFVQWTDESGAVVSKQMDFIYTMPAHDSQLTAEYEYNPANPANPVRNYWNKMLGEVIVDDFTTGQLQSAVRTAIGDSQASEVAMITVAGIINNNDFGVANNYTNCTLLDLSRVTGVTQVPSYAFDYTKLESVYLPATIEKMGYRAFYECKQLSSLVIYAMTPPTLENQVFSGVPDGLIVYVPAAAIAQYQDAAGWKDFTLLPIQEDIRSISVSLPTGTRVADYTNMWLELTNEKNGQRIHYVMTDRMMYTFANIIRNTAWNVTLRNERGDVFGRIDNVEVKDEDVAVTFTKLSKPQSVSLSVVTPDGKNVTEQAQVTWTDAQGNYVAQATSLSGLPVGYQVNYRLTLSQELAMMYDTPLATEYTLKDGGNNLTCQLQPIGQVQLSGKVMDATTGLPVSGAVISASQTFGGKYSKTIIGKTDGKGVFTMNVSNVPTSVAFAATDYVSQTLDLSNNELHELNELEDVSLKPITGATISLGFTYTTCDGETQEWYSDYQNVGYELFNVTKNRAISLFNVQFPQIVLLEDVDDGDVLRLTATSLTTNYTNSTNVGAFMPVQTTVTIAEQKAEATFNITQLGKIQASYTRSGNVDVTASLYDDNGKLIKTYNYVDMALAIDDLADGDYTLVSMGYSQFFNSIYDLAQLPQTGLVKGTDYVQHTVRVSSGEVTTVDIDLVPQLNESKFYYTGDNTSFTVNKPSIVVGNYLTLTGHIDFKAAYATKVSNVNLIVDLPESCQFVENSVMVGNSTSSYTLNGNRITIPMARYTDRVRFCIIPTHGGEYAPSAFAQFDLNGKTVTQPMGAANYTANSLLITVPSTVARTTIPISGTAIGVCDIEVYDNDILIGQTRSIANGVWATTCELNEPYNLSTHKIKAKIITKAGVELESETMSCLYDKNAIEVKTVTMINTAHTAASLDLYDYVTVFDFQNPATSLPPYWYWPSYPDFTFIVDLTNNDTTVVKDVTIWVYTDRSNWRELKASYDAKTDRWVAVSQFGSEELPVGVDVVIDAQTEPIVDLKMTQDAVDNIQQLGSYFINSVDALNAANESQSGEGISKILEELGISDNDFERSYDTDSLQAIFDGMTEEELEQYAKDNFGDFTNYYNSVNEDLNHILESLYLQDLYFPVSSSILNTKIESCAGIEENSLIEKGFEKLKTTSDKYIYIKSTEKEFEYICFFDDIHIISTDSNLASDLARIRAKAPSFNPEMIYEWTNQLQSYIGLLKDFYDRLNGKVSLILKPLTKLQSELNTKIGFRSQWAKNTKNVAMFLVYKQEIEQLERQLALVKLSIKTINGIIANIAKYLDVVKYTMIVADFAKDVSHLYGLYKACIPCDGKDYALAEQYKADLLQKALFIFSYYCGYMAFDCSTSTTAILQAISGWATGGSTVATAIGTILLKTAISETARFAEQRLLNSYISKMSNKIAKLDCNDDDKCPRCGKKPCECQDKCPICGNKPCTCKNKCPRCGKKPCECQDKCPKCGNKPCTCKNKCPRCGQNPCACPPPQPQPNPILDPSGYVYESVATNRLQGVTATCYYKEYVEDMYGDLHENIVKWDAEEYAQENPLFTDESGMYAWDVPQGLWQVKFEKEGYETTYSEWLPVPPPQLDINIAMKQNVQPNVKTARAYEDAVEVEFDKYMMPELLTTENIMVMQKGKAVEGTIELLNEEVSYEGETETFASKVRFNAVKPFTAKEVTLIVNNRVKSYAGIRMQDNYQQTFTVEQEIKQIACEEQTVVRYGEKATLTVSVLPASASKGKVLTVKTSSPMILGIETEQVFIDNDGKAEITISGELPGAAALTFTLEGKEKTGQTIVSVKQTDDTVMKGDVDQNGVVDVADLALTINHVLNRVVQGEDAVERMDMNTDGQVNVGDVILIVRAILEQGGTVSVPASARGNAQTVDWTKYTAMQLNVVAPSGTKVSDIRLTGANAATHQLMWQQTGDGRYTVVVFSLDNTPFSPVDGSMIDVTTDGGGKATTADVLLTTPTGERLLIGSLSGEVVTGIRTMPMDHGKWIMDNDVYDLQGRKVNAQSHASQLKKGVYVKKGKKVIK